MSRGAGRPPQTVVCGINAVASLLRRSPERVVAVYLQADLGRKRLGRIAPELDRAPVDVRRVGVEQLTELARTANHQGVVAQVEPAPVVGEAEARALVERALVEATERPLILVLDGIEDPRNFGACLRSADAAGVNLVVTARSRNVGITAAVSKVASGAAETQPVAQVGNLVRFLEYLHDVGVWIVGADGTAPESLYEADLTGPVAIVLGAEGRGLRRLTRERCDALVSLPMHGTVDSLNISVAAGICLYETVRQRRSGGLDR